MDAMIAMVLLVGIFLILLLLVVLALFGYEYFESRKRESPARSRRSERLIEDYVEPQSKEFDYHMCRLVESGIVSDSNKEHMSMRRKFMDSVYMELERRDDERWNQGL